MIRRVLVWSAVSVLVLWPLLFVVSCSWLAPREAGGGDGARMLGEGTSAVAAALPEPWRTVGTLAGAAVTTIGGALAARSLRRSSRTREALTAAVRGAERAPSSARKAIRDEARRLGVSDVLEAIVTAEGKMSRPASSPAPLGGGTL